MPTICISRSGTPRSGTPRESDRGGPGRTPPQILASRRRSARARGRTILFSAALVLSTLGFSWLAGFRTGPPQADGRVERVATDADAAPELLDEADLHAGLADATIVAVNARVPVTVAADGRDREITAAEGATVGALLDRLGIEVDRDDRVTPPLVEEVREGTQVVVQRVTHTVEARRMAVPRPVRERFTVDLPIGEHREVSAGREGTLHVVERVTWVDGVPEARVRTEERMVVAPKPRVIEVGAGFAGSAGSAEEGDEAEGPAPIFDEEQIDTLTGSQTGGASWYVYGDELTAAHRTLPKGTVVTVTNLANGKKVKVRINDRGPYIPGRVIDLNRVAFSQIASASEGVIDVRITW